MIPVKIKALNQDSSDESNVEDEENPITKEALEQKLQFGYREALLLQKQNKLKEAENILLQLIKSDVLNNAHGKVKYVNGRVQPSIFHLKYCCFLNLGNISFKMDRYELALKYYALATELDDTDLNLWYKIGNVAMKIPNLMFAVCAFTETLYRNPHHWPSLNSIITATYALGDMMACLLYIHQALSLDNGYRKGSILKERIFKEHPHIKEDFYSLYPQVDERIPIEFDNEEAYKCFREIDDLKVRDRKLSSTLYGVTNQEIPIRGLLKPLKHNSWICLGKSLLKLYKYLYNVDSNDMIFFSKINMKSSSSCNDSNKEAVSSVISFATESITSAAIIEENVLCELSDENHHQEKNTVPPSDHENCTVSNTIDSNNKEDKDRNVGSCKNEEENAGSNELDQDEDNVIDDDDDNVHNNNHDDNDDDNDDENNDDGDDDDDGGDDEDDDDNEGEILKELNASSSKIEDTEKCVLETNNRTKRRKCSPTLADQLKLCDKRRSTRNKTVLKSNEPSLSKVLKNLIPSDLLPQKKTICKSSYFELMRWNDDSFDTMDIYRLLFEHQDQNNLPSYPVNEVTEQSRNKMLLEEKYFGSEKEKSDVEWYINMYNEQPLLELIEAYLRELARKWSIIWPAFLTSIFLEMCRILQKHGKVLQIFCKSEMNAFNEESLKLLKDNLLLVLMFGELSLDDYFVDADKGQPLSGSIFGGHFSSLLLGEMRDACSILNVIETDVKLWMRTCWLEAMLFLQKKNSYAASSALSMIVEDITDSDIEIRLPNLRQFYLISQSNARRLLNTLIRNEDLNRVKYLIADEQFNRVIEILENTLKPDCQQLIQIPNEITLSRYQQYTILLDALSEAKRYEELFKWCEVCCYESFAVYRKSFFDEIDTDMKSKWASLVMKTLNGMLWCFKNVGQTILNTLNQEDLVRLVQTFCSLICHQIEASDPIPEITTSTVAPWILLCNIVRFHEKNRDIANEDDNVSAEVFVSPSMSLLFVAHEYLGKRCWCCFDDGALLFYTLDVIEDMYKQSVLFSETWQTLAQQIDQIFYCLYAHPFKRNKPRYVQEHNSLGLALTWNRAVQAYCFYRPVQLPMFDAVSKQYTISADTETLLKRMIPLIPPEHNPGRFLDCANQLTNNVVDDIAIDENALQSEVADIFYLLGDYYFKNKIMNKAIKYYLLDVRFNRQRFDSWAAMALARGSQLETKLNSCETIKNESDILKKADLTDKCYKTALELDTNQPTLWIEYGVFCYSIHGFCSRLLKQETTTLSLQMFDTLENRKNELLKMSFKCFNAANDAWIEMTKRQMDIQDERWLHHYMLGKIAEKNEEKISVYMNHYLKASELLHQNGAQYPSRILYSSPQYYSVEALEIYYRIHATILKFLEAHEEKPLDESVIDVLLDVTGQLSECAFVKAVSSRSDNGGNGKCSENLSCERRAETTEDKKNEETAQNVENDVRQILEETLALIVDNESDKSMPIKRKLSADLDLSDISSTTKKLRVEGDKTELEYFHNEELIKKGFSTKTTDIDTQDVTSSTCENKDESFQSNKTETTIKQNNAHALLTDKCIAALEECVRRFPEHYKSYYRLANHYFRSKKYKHIEKARKYLLEDGGLFADRKASNFFSGIWRIPTGEIDRSGSFAFHMSRSVHLLVDVLRDTQDFKMLLNLSMQLRDMPELDKKYIRDNEREQICKEALSLSVQTLRKHIDNLSPTENEETKRKLLLEVYKCHQRMSRFYTQKDAPFGKLLQSVFCKYTNRKDKVNLEQIVSFCRSLNSASKETLSTTLLSFQFKDNCKMISSKSNDVPAKLQALNFAMTSDTKAHSNGNARKGSNDGRANHNNVLPNNLKNLPSAITVTTVPKNKNPATTNSQGSLWNKFKANKDLDLKLKFAPPFAHSSCEEERKLKMDSKSKFNPMSKAMLVDASNASKISRPYVKVTKPYCKEKTNSKMKCLPSSDKSIIEESASTIISDKGLTITPVMSKDTKSGGTSATHTISKFFASEMKNTPVTSNKCSSNSVKVDVSFSASERQGLFITPVVDKTKNQPTLQQKLAAKQLANVGPALKNSSAPKYANVINTTTAFDISKNLGSSGVSIFPLPLSDANSSGVALIGSRSSSNAVNTTVSSSAAAFQSQQSAVFISHVSASSSSSPSPSPSTSSKKYASSMVENSQKPKSKPSETAEVLDCKHYNKNIMPDSGDSRKRSDEKLKNVLKALEESSNIIITPKSSNKPEQPEVIILE